MAKSLGAIFFLLVFIHSKYCMSQDQILKLNGKTTDITFYELKGDWVYYKRADDPKSKLRRYDKFDIFSVLKSDGSEDVIYDPDTTYENDPTTEQIRRYIKGEQWGMANYHKPWNKAGGAASGIASSFAGYYGPPGIFLYALIAGSFNVKDIPQSPGLDATLYASDEFKAGYRKYARNKKIQQSLTWGGVGFAIGFPVFLLVFHD